MLHIETSITIRTPQPTVAAIYRNYDDWPRVFPTIKAVRLIREEAGKQILEIDHQEGRVVNILTDVSPEQIELKEWKKRYDATFVNRFEAIPEGTRFTLAADISLKGVYKLLAPFMHGYIRQQMTTLVLDPIRRVAEGRQ
jgi:Polyketide cyclase / dehydrase and lipid transport